MKMFPDCAGRQCCVCKCGNFCLAGNGDDDFSLASKEEIIERLDKGGYDPSDVEYMVSCLKRMYDYEYRRGDRRVQKVKVRRIRLAETD